MRHGRSVTTPMCSDVAQSRFADGTGEETAITIQVKLFASLHVYLPSGAARNEASVQAPGEVTPNSLLDRLGVPREMAHLVLRNGVYLRPEERDRAVFRDGDAFAVWPPVAGG